MPNRHGSIVLANAGESNPVFHPGAGRSRARYNDERAKGALLLPHDQVRERAAKVLPDKSAAIDLYCRSGRRSGLAQEALKEMGYTNVSNLGSLAALKKGGVETESGAAAPAK